MALKRCPICGLNIADAYFDRHVSGHGSTTAKEHAQSVAEQRQWRAYSEAKKEEERKEQERIRALPPPPPVKRSRYGHKECLADLTNAIEALRDSLREFPGTEFDAMLRALSKINVNSFQGIKEFQRFVIDWCGEDDFGKECYSFGGSSQKDAACDKIVKAATRVEDLVDSLLNVEAAETVEELTFQIACMDAGCVPPLVAGCGKKYFDDLKRELIRQRAELLSPRGSTHRIKE